MQNKYEVIGIVGEGAYGIVYKCRNKETKEFVAIKKFKEIEDEIVKKTMKRELKVLQLLKNENCVEFKEAFKRKNNLFLVFEFVERNLLELIEESPHGLDQSLIKSLIYQLCNACNYLHKMNIIHRDIKPENLLINNNNQLKLCDFGFARKVNNLSFNNCMQPKKKEQLTDYVATRWYRAPELLITGGFYGPEVDFWAIGCIMGELADGNPLFPGENELDQLHCIQKVLGNLPDYLVDMFYNNPIFYGQHLLNVDKPETLEKRYMGKLTNVAINFMKCLLEVDPKKRLFGDKVFSHPYFKEFAKKDNVCDNNNNNNNNFSDSNMKYNANNNDNANSNNINNNSNNISIKNSNLLSKNSFKIQNINNSNINTNISNNNTQIIEDKNNINSNNSNNNNDGKIINTTINIINYNTFNSSQQSSSNNLINNNIKIKNSQAKVASPPRKEKKELTLTILNDHCSSVNNKIMDNITNSNSPHISEISFNNQKNKNGKEKKNPMAMTMTNKFPQKYQKNILKTYQNKNSNGSNRKSYEYLKERESHSLNKYNSNNNNNYYNEYLTGYKTFYNKKFQKDKYNYPINTTGNNNNNYYRPIIEEEEDEYKGNNNNLQYKLTDICNSPVNSKEKTKFNFNLNLNHNFHDINFPNKKSNSKNKNGNYYKNNKNMHNNIYLPFLCKNNNSNNINNYNTTNYGYYSNIKKFRQMINNK